MHEVIVLSRTSSTGYGASGPSAPRSSSGRFLRSVVSALAGGGLALPAGQVSTDLGDRTVRVDSRYRTREDITPAVVVRRDGDGNCSPMVI